MLSDQVALTTHNPLTFHQKKEEKKKAAGGATQARTENEKHKRHIPCYATVIIYLWSSPMIESLLSLQHNHTIFPPAMKIPKQVVGLDTVLDTVLDKVLKTGLDTGSTKKIF